MPTPTPISPQMRERWFLITMGLATAALIRLMAPFLTVMLFAAVVTVVAWPLFLRARKLLRGHSALAAVSTGALLMAAVFGPLGGLVGLMAEQVVAVATAGVNLVQGGELQKQLERIDLDRLRSLLPDAVESRLPKDMVGAAMEPIQSAVLMALNALGSQLPALLNTTAGALMDTLIFMVCVVVFFMEGPALVTVVKDVSPLDDALDEELMGVFAQLCHNLVVGALGTAAAMGTVASVGYLLAGLPDALMWGALTGLLSFVPVLGSALISGPLVVYAFAQISPGTGGFLLVWSVLLTAQVDTLVRPMFMRGGTELHPLAIILALLGGVTWLGAPGALLGPVIVAFFWTLHGIYGRHYLGWPPASPPPPTRTSAMVHRLRAWWAARGTPAKSLGPGTASRGEPPSAA
jgi:predicted PurR-regulated permease PerM